MCRSFVHLSPLFVSCSCKANTGGSISALMWVRSVDRVRQCMGFTGRTRLTGDLWTPSWHQFFFFFKKQTNKLEVRMKKRKEIKNKYSGRTRWQEGNYNHKFEFFPFFSRFESFQPSNFTCECVVSGCVYISVLPTLSTTDLLFGKFQTRIKTALILT